MKALLLAGLLLMTGPGWAENEKDQKSAGGAGAGLEGVITIGPIHGGPIKVGVPSTKPLANTAFVVEGEKGAVASFTTDNDGHFQISLQPGHYSVSMKGEKSRFRRGGPFHVDVTEGKTTKVEWNCDTGMR